MRLPVPTVASLQQLWPRLLLLTTFLAHKAWSIRCIQCDEHKDNKALMRKCLDGQVAATACPNRTHTHCITNAMTWLWTTNEGHLHVHERQIMWRKCGRAADIKNCSDYRLPHEQAPDGFATMRMCAYGCDRDDCFIAGAQPHTVNQALIAITTLTLFVLTNT